MADIRKAADWIDSALFRPPYGRIQPFQAYLLRKAKDPFRIIMWDVLSGDFDESKSAEDCFQNIKKHARKGSVIVFHDSEKALPRMMGALDQTLLYFSEKGYCFEAIR
jgi:hypothetical protein